MRCYFMRSGQYVAAEILAKDDDQGLVAQSRALFETRGKARGAEGFEVWDHGRFVYRYPDKTEAKPG